VVVVLIVFMFTKLPDITIENESEQEENPPMKNLLKHPAFVMAVIAQFLYVAAQTGINSFFINFVTDEMTSAQIMVGSWMSQWGTFGEIFMPKSDEQAASLILALGGMGSFFIGRLSGAFIMKYIAPGKLLKYYAIANVILIILVISKLGWLSVIALFSTYFFMSVMFPTIFALGIKDLGTLTKKGSSFLVMAVAGGAFCPPIMGAIADQSSMSIAFIIPLLCFGFIVYYAAIGSKLKQKKII